MSIFTKIFSYFRKEPKEIKDLRKKEILERIEDVKKRVKNELPSCAFHWSFEELINYILSPLLKINYIPFEEQFELFIIDDKIENEEI